MKMTRRLPVWKVYERGTICQWKASDRGIFSAKKGKASDLGVEPPRINFFSAPHPPPPPGTTLVDIRDACVCTSFGLVDQAALLMIRRNKTFSHTLCCH